MLRFVLSVYIFRFQMLPSVENIHVNSIGNIWFLHFLWHPCVPAQEAAGSPGTTAADGVVSPCAVVPIPRGAPSPAAPTPVAASAQPLGGCDAQTPAAARAP